MASNGEFKNCSLLTSSMQDTELGAMFFLPNKNGTWAISPSWSQTFKFRNPAVYSVGVTGYLPKNKVLMAWTSVHLHLELSYSMVVVIPCDYSLLLGFVPLVS